MKQASQEPAAQSRNGEAVVPDVRADPEAGLSREQIIKLYEKLRDEEARLAEEIKRRIQEAVTEAERLPDEGDQASQNANQAYLLRYADKQNKLLQQVRHALHKMKSGEYGICEGSGEPIGVQRLMLRPWTRYSVEYKEQLDRDRRYMRR